jgi:hypothetical protein
MVEGMNERKKKKKREKIESGILMMKWRACLWKGISREDFGNCTM